MCTDISGYGFFWYLITSEAGVDGTKNYLKSS
jgi:hypothetical protein